MENRKSLILHFDSLDVIDELSDKQNSDLIKAIRDYNLGKEVQLEGLMKAVFIPFKNQFDRDLEKYKRKCEVNAKNGKKGGRPKETEENPVGYCGIKNNPNKAYNDNDNDNDSKNDNDNDSKNDNDNDSNSKNNNKLIISKEITETSSEILKDNRREDINEMQEFIKNTVMTYGLIYKQGKQERNRIQNILTGKDFGLICEKANMSRQEFIGNIIRLSTMLEFWNGKIYNAETLYKHYASVYNEAVKVKASKPARRGC